MRTLKPKVPLGEEDLAKKEEEFEEIENRFLKSTRVLSPILPNEITPDEKVKNGNSASSLSSDVSSIAPPPRIYLARMPAGTSTAISEPLPVAVRSAESASVSSSAASGAAADGSAVEMLFKVLDIPTKSGLDGPIGTVLDFLLDVLIKVGGYTSAALGESTVQRIIEAVSAIKFIIGLSKDFEAESALKGLFDLLKLEFPALEAYEKFFDLFVDGLFAFRGELQDIIDWFKEALVVLIDELDLVEETRNALKTILDEIMSLGEEFYEVVKNSENVVNALLSWFVERIMPQIIEKFLNALYEHVSGEFADKLIAIQDGVGKIASILNAVVKFAITSDSSALLDNLLFSLFDVFSFYGDLGEAGLNRITALLKLVSAVLGYSPKEEKPENFYDFSIALVPIIPAGGWPLWTVDVNGNKLAKTGTITDVYGSPRDMDSDNNTDIFHTGVDIAAPQGTAVFPVAAGRVTNIYGVSPFRVVEVTTPYQVHSYVHVINLTNIGEQVTTNTRIATVDRHPLIDHLHFQFLSGALQLRNPLMPLGPLADIDTLGQATVDPFRTYAWRDDGGANGNIDYVSDGQWNDTSRRFVSGKIDIVTRAFDPAGVAAHGGQLLNAGVRQLMWKVDDGSIKYIIKDGQWDDALNNALAPLLYKETPPADTDNYKQEYFYIITNTNDPEKGTPNNITRGGYWNTKLQQGLKNELWNGPDAGSNAEAQYPDGYHLIWIQAGSDIARDIGRWTPYHVNINNFNQTIRTTDAARTSKNTFSSTEQIYLFGEGYKSSRPYKVYVFNTRTWQDRDNLTQLNPVYTQVVTSDEFGRIDIKQLSFKRPGTYDIVVDYDNDKLYSTPRFGKTVDALCQGVVITGSASSQSAASSPMNTRQATEEQLFLGSIKTAPASASSASQASSASVQASEFNIETFEPAFRNWADQVMLAIREAVEQGQTEVKPFGDKIQNSLESAIQQAGLTVSESTKRATVDAVVLVAGVMNPNFNKWELPTLVAITRDILADLSIPSETMEIVDNVITTIMSIAAIIKDDGDLKQVIAKEIGQFDSQYGSIATLINKTVGLVLKTLGQDSATIQSLQNYIDTFTSVGQATFNIVKNWRENKVQGVIQTVVQGVGFALSQYYDLDLQIYAKIVGIAFPEAAGLDKPPTPEEAVQIMDQLLQGLGIDDQTKEVIITVVEFIAGARDVYSDGYRWILNQLMDWLSGKVDELANYLENELNNILSQYSLFHLEGEFALELGSFSAFGLKYDLALDAGVDLKIDELFTFVSSVIFDGYDPEIGSIEDTFKIILSFVEITPIFKASLELGGFGSNANPLMNTLLESLGVEMQFSGGGHFTIQLLSFKGGAFERSGFLKVIEWGFYFTIEISRKFTLLDFLTGGVGGGALNKLADYIGLDGIAITVFFTLTVEIIKRAASPIGPEQATFTLIIAIGVALTIGISILIAKIKFYGSLQVIFTFIQDLLGDTPLKIFLDLVAYVKVTIELVFTDIKTEWGPKTLYHHDFTAGNKAAAKGASETMGVDTDDDGLSDEYEAAVPGLRADLPDTDRDGLTDKEELQTTKTDPLNPDTDGDGLSDCDEVYKYKTNPKRVDTDYDGVGDYEEVMTYKTKPTVMDTDEDGLDDNYEIHHAWDTSNCTTSVKEVWIGEVAYNDHTDPLDPDTDDDGLLDGEEGPGGAYYGLKALYNETDPKVDKNPIIFNYGYTHPLDNDTDDDSYMQLWNGTKALIKGKNAFLRSMTDGEEVKGIWVTFMTEGEPNRTLVRTNPCNPDTDGDTGATTRTNVPPGAYLNNDGYELALNPPTDPTNGDTDHDGLIDGLEGVLAQGSRHTNPNNPDTDGDGLGDMQEILLGTDPRNADTDFDLVLDGDEYHKFHTNPHLNDSDYDGLEDYEELFFWHCNPNLKDSDADRISDGLEVLQYGTNPMDEDTDNDGLTDYDEIFKHGTDPFNQDTDRDRLSDFEEVNRTRTDPLNWDTDGDSILYPNEYGEMTWPISDGDEAIEFNTDPARTDTDNDGLSDSIELYLASGRIPRRILEPIPLIATNNDTDGDGLLDGEELKIGNTTSIIYPYLALMPYSFYNTSVLIADTDGDGLTDFEEVNGTLPNDRSFEAGVAKFNYTGSMPYLWDTDNDTLSDGDEVFYHGTDPARSDTDCDGLTDNVEKTLAGVAVDYGTSALNPDTDGDLLPDGYELDSDIIGNVIQRYSIQLDPRNPDANNNGILDGYEIDLDNDGLSDGEEFFVYHTYKVWKKGSAYAGGFLNPDSDGDGISDGVEVNEFGTDPTKIDTDGDGYSDGAEVAVGTDPLSFTSAEEYQEALDRFRAGRVIRIVYPKNATLTDTTADVRVVNSTFIETMWFRYNDGTGWSENFTLQYDTVNMQWEYTDIIWQEKSYWIQVFGSTATGYVVWDQQWFTISLEKEEIPFYKGWAIKILSPTNATTYDKSVDVRVINATNVVNMWFRYDSGTGWRGNYTLKHNPATREYENTSITWSEGSYHLQAFAYTTSKEVVWDEQWFTISEKIDWIRIVSPTNTTILDAGVDLLVLNSTAVNTMQFRYRSVEGWSNNYTLQYNQIDQRWENTTTVWPEGSCHLLVFATTPDGIVLSDEEWFSIQKPIVEPTLPLYMLVLGVLVGGAGTSASFFILQRRRRRKNEMVRETGEPKKAEAI